MAGGRRLAIAGLLGLLVAACGTGVAPSGRPSTASPDVGASPSPGPEGVLPTCEGIGLLAAPDAWYRPEPVYIANEMPADEVRAWAQDKPGFQELWNDRDRNGWLGVGFTEGVEERQAELEAAFPGAGVVAVAVPHSAAELEALQARVFDEARELGVVSTSASVPRGVVMVGIGVLDPDRVSALSQLFAGEPMCVDGIPPEEAPPEGPQPEGGDGWRLLGNASGQGQAYRTGIGWDDASYADLWQLSGLPGEPPPVDFESEVAIWLGAVTGSSCPNLRLDDVVVDEAAALVYGELVLLDVGGCTDDIFPVTFVVALERERLPAGPFAIQLGPEDPPGGAPEERTVVDADLSVPGSAPGPGEVHPDEGLANPPATVVEPGDVVEPGFEPPFRFPVGCGVEWLGPLNNVWWRTDDPEAAGGRLPDEWAQYVVDGTLTGAIALRTNPARLDVTVGERTLAYVPGQGEPPCP